VALLDSRPAQAEGTLSFVARAFKHELQRELQNLRIVGVRNLAENARAEVELTGAVTEPAPVCQ
jgi:hypothetical protein